LHLMEGNEAIILAGGLGTRLRSVVPELPKCMAPVGSQPFIGHVIDHFKNEGVHRFIFALGYRSESFEDFLSSKLSPSEIVISTEEEPLGTGGAIRKACKLVNSKTALIANGDTLFKVDASKLISFHDKCSADCTLALKPMKKFNRYGVVDLNKDNSVNSFQEKQQYEEGLINGGVYALEVKKFLVENLPAKFSFEKDYLEKFYQSRRIFGLIQDKYFIDIGVPEDYEKAQVELGT